MMRLTADDAVILCSPPDGLSVEGSMVLIRAGSDTSTQSLYCIRSAIRNGPQWQNPYKNPWIRMQLRITTKI